MPAQVLNTTAGTSGKTLLFLEGAQTITGAKTFDLGASAPFICVSGSAVVTNLDADKLDGQHGSYYQDAGNLNAGTLLVARLPTAFLGITTDGTSVQQIAFAAVQSASAGANTLDDYEEGTWTPTLTFGGAAVGLTYGAQLGMYVKIGQFVFVGLRLTLTAKGSSTGAALINSLPFTSMATHYGGGAGLFYNNMASMAGLGGFVGPSATSITPSTFGATSSTQLNDTHFTATSDLIMVAGYRASA